MLEIKPFNPQPTLQKRFNASKDNPQYLEPLNLTIVTAFLLENKLSLMCVQTIVFNRLNHCVIGLHMNIMRFCVILNQDPLSHQRSH